ncbi:hypothetical protein pdam_00024237, partial [Pocillopora damicornis]
MNHFWVFTFACAIFIIVHSAPNWGPLPNEYFQEFYDHYSENMQNHVEYLKHVHEAHHENQHRVHEKFQENFYDVNERQQEGSESDQEAYERSQEDLRSADSDKRSTLHGRVWLSDTNSYLDPLHIKLKSRLPRFIHESHHSFALNRIFFSANEETLLKYNEQLLVKETKQIAGK